MLARASSHQGVQWRSGQWADDSELQDSRHHALAVVDTILGLQLYACRRDLKKVFGCWPSDMHAGTCSAATNTLACAARIVVGAWCRDTGFHSYFTATWREGELLGHQLSTSVSWCVCVCVCLRCHFVSMTHLLSQRIFGFVTGLESRLPMSACTFQHRVS